MLEWYSNDKWWKNAGYSILLYILSRKPLKPEQKSGKKTFFIVSECETNNQCENFQSKEKSICSNVYSPLIPFIGFQQT